MGTLILKSVIILFSGLLFGAAGLIAGAYIGGNFLENFAFNGVRGYEATGQAGLFAGSAVGVALGSALTFMHSKRKT